MAENKVPENTAIAVLGVTFMNMLMDDWSESEILELCRDQIAQAEDAYRKAQWAALDAVDGE